MRKTDRWALALTAVAILMIAAPVHADVAGVPAGDTDSLDGLVDGTVAVDTHPWDVDEPVGMELEGLADPVVEELDGHPWGGDEQAFYLFLDPLLGLLSLL